jgi:TatD DNase family protein
VLIHCRKAFQRTLRVLNEEGAGRVGGIMHAFSGSAEMAKECIQLGFAIGLCGSVTWEKALRPVRLAREIPLESLVLETDAPDLAPHPFRGQPNHPSLLVQILATVAHARSVPLDEVAQATGSTSQRVLKLLRTGFSANLC